ncbi:MAG TPA: SMI1/KNR4 family protein [Umezawaea sp.]|nr:SMI1/KNR4 family protein [Umezawaea sp.]
MSDREFPPALAAALAVEFDYRDGEGVDFEPYDEFESPEETAHWLRLWTEAELDPAEFRMFGSDGTGGYAGLWKGAVVFFGSEGEAGVVAANIGDFLWLLADGSGPMEAVEYPDQASKPDAAFTAVAEEWSDTPRKTAAEVVAAAAVAFPGFAEMVQGPPYSG